MKKLITLILVCFLMACSMPGEDGLDGSDGTDGKSGTNGKDGVTEIIEHPKSMETTVLFDGEILTYEWQTLALPRLTYTDFVEMVFIHDTTGCIVIKYQVNDYDVNIVNVENKNSIVFIADKTTVFKWQCFNIGESIRIELNY